MLRLYKEDILKMVESLDTNNSFITTENLTVTAGNKKNLQIILKPNTVITHKHTRLEYTVVDVNVSDPRNPIVICSRGREKFFIKKEISKGNQIFWVCPLIEESKKLDYSAAVKKYHYLLKTFPKKVGLIHGSLEKDEKNKVLNNFLEKKIDILVSTTVIEVGIDFPHANVIVIENSNKFGLSQLHQLRGRVGRGTKQGTCILLYKKNLSENAKKE